MGEFGPMIHAAQVERAARETLQEYLPWYLAAMERDLGLAPRTLPNVRSWIVSSDVDRWQEEALPSVLLLSTGLAEAPRRDGKGSYSARFALGVAIVATAPKADKADELAKILTAVVRTILVQQGSLGGFAAATDWEDERYDVLPNRSRSLAAGQIVTSVQVDDVAAVRSGPRGTPPEDPYGTPSGPRPIVQDATATVTPSPLPGQ